MSHGSGPFDTSPPAQAGVFYGQIEQFKSCLVRWEASSRLDDFPERAVQRFDGICCVDHFADRGRESEKRNDMLPDPAPGLPDRRIALAPFGLEFIEPDQCHSGVFRPVDRLDPGHDGLSVFPADEGKTVSDQMHDARLDERLRKDRRNGFRKAFQPIDGRDQDVVDATDFRARRRQRRFAPPRAVACGQH